jgi:FAD/FMN-containing dehydrogenase
MTAFQLSSFQSWGRIERRDYATAHPRHLDALASAIGSREVQTCLAVGLGRSYGDTALNAGGGLINMTGLDRIQSFDAETGVLRAEAGASIDSILSLVVPQGWFLATTPGTRFVTLGGAVANDIHGKNHHRAGSFGCCVRRLGLLRSDGTHLDLDAMTGGALFAATIGGLGLTGIITWVEIDLVRIGSSAISVERTAFGSIREFVSLAADASASHEHTVAWIDCASRGNAFGRGIFQRANWAEGGELQPHADKQRMSFPFDAPSLALNKLSVRAFNALYWRAQKAGPALANQHYGNFFYPLDAIGRWNRFYGPKGFYQYQCVIPFESAEPATTQLLGQISSAGAGSFLAVLKTLGDRKSPGYLSFPRAGVTLALDFPNRGTRTLELLARLDRVVLEAGGRLYPAKDGRMPASVFRACYADNLEAFQAQVDPKFCSDFWRRVSA